MKHCNCQVASVLESVLHRLIMDCFVYIAAAAAVALASKPSLQVDSVFLRS